MPTPIDRDELQRLPRKEHAQLVEVLPSDEYEDEHLPGAINIPLKTLDAETTRQLERGDRFTGGKRKFNGAGSVCPSESGQCQVAIDRVLPGIHARSTVVDIRHGSRQGPLFCL